MTHQLAHLKVYGCKCYVLLKGSEGIHKPKKSNKLAPRAFVGFLVGYDSSNIYRVWDPIINTVKGYRDVVFDERVTYHPSMKGDIIKEKEKVDHTVTFNVYRAEPYYDELEDDEFDSEIVHVCQKLADGLSSILKEV